MPKSTGVPRLLSCLALLGALLIGVAFPAIAQTCDPAGATSLSQACGWFGDCKFRCNSLICFDSGAQAPLFPPVSSSVFHVFSDPTFLDFQVSATGIVNVGSFGATAHASGSTTVDRSEHGATAQNTGIFNDCATAGGYSGAGVLHIPIHLTGSRALTYSPGGYTPPPPPSPPPSYAQLRILCGAMTVGSGVATNCDGPSSLWEASGDIDTTVELVFGFSFGQPVKFSFASELLATVGDKGNGVAEATGSLTADADVTLAGTLLPAYITDPAGSPLVGATLQSDSGFDYLTAPEPRGAWAAAAIALALLRRARQSFAMIRSA